MKKLKPFETAVKPITPIYELKRSLKLYMARLEREEPSSPTYKIIQRRISDIANSIRAYQRHENEYFGSYRNYGVSTQQKKSFFTREKIMYFAGLFNPKQFLP